MCLLIHVALLILPLPQMPVEAPHQERIVELLIYMKCTCEVVLHMGYENSARLLRWEET